VGDGAPGGPQPWYTFGEEDKPKDTNIPVVVPPKNDS